jgi:hypothetical protein
MSDSQEYVKYKQEVEEGYRVVEYVCVGEDKRESVFGLICFELRIVFESKLFIPLEVAR